MFLPCFVWTAFPQSFSLDAFGLAGAHGNLWGCFSGLLGSICRTQNCASQQNIRMRLDADFATTSFSVSWLGIKNSIWMQQHLTNIWLLEVMLHWSRTRSRKPTEAWPWALIRTSKPPWNRTRPRRQLLGHFPGFAERVGSWPEVLLNLCWVMICGDAQWYWSSLIIIDHHWSSLIIIDHHWSWYTYIDDHEYSWIIR